MDSITTDRMKRPDFQNSSVTKLEILPTESDAQTIRPPKEIAEVIKRDLKDFKGISAPESETRKLLLNLAEQGLGRGNYREFLTFLLHAEYVEEKTELSKLTIHNARLFRKSNVEPVMLTVVGLKDKRPNVIKGDWVIAQFSHSEYYRLEVASVRGVNLAFKDNVKLLRAHFNRRSPGRIEVRTKVFFQVNESGYRAMHKAIRALDAHKISNGLFPATAAVVPGRNQVNRARGKQPKAVRSYQRSDLVFFNASVASNPEQLEFVSMIVVRSQSAKGGLF